VVVRRCDPVFREDPLFDDDLALATRLASVADGFDLDAERASGIQQVCACCDIALASRWLKDYATGMLWHDHSIQPHDGIGEPVRQPKGRL